MTKQLDRLQAAGHVKRVPNPDDRRSSLVRLTPRGCKLIDAALEDHFAAESDILAELGPGDTDRCVELLRLLARRVRRWSASTSADQGQGSRRHRTARRLARILRRPSDRSARAARSAHIRS
jgi:hypothetical protein